MKFKSAADILKAEQAGLDALWMECWAEARIDVRGNWLEPDVKKRTLERAYQIADERMRYMDLTGLQGYTTLETC